MGQAIEVLSVPPSSQASQLPHFELSTPALTCKPNPLWELSSFSEAAKAVGQATEVSPVPPLSQRCGDPTSQLPHFELCTPAPTCKPNPLWELSSFSEAAMAVGQPTEVSPVPPLSQASQLPHLNCVHLHPPAHPIPCGSCRALARLRWRWARQQRFRLCHRYRRQASSRFDGVHHSKSGSLRLAQRNHIARRCTSSAVGAVVRFPVVPMTASRVAAICTCSAP